MTEEFSIEDSANKIYDPLSQQNFNEVHSSYNLGNYRSSIVMLWSVIVCDLIYKLNALVVEYDDDVAKKILDEINTLRDSNPTSSQWESDLVKKIRKRTKLIDLADEQDLLHIQAQRHLCAHPVIKFDSPNKALYRPTREQVRAHMRTALEKVLTLSPLISKDVLNHLLLEVEELSKEHTDINFWKRYLEGGIFKQLSKDLAHLSPKYL